MSSTDHSNNALFRELVESSGLSLATAMTLFNRGLAEPVTESVLKGWLAAPGSSRHIEIPEASLAHAQRVFSDLAKTPAADRRAEKPGAADEAG